MRLKSELAYGWFDWLFSLRVISWFYRDFASIQRVIRAGSPICLVYLSITEFVGLIGKYDHF